MAPSPELPLLSAADAAFLQSGLSIVAASRNDLMIPSIGRAIGCRVAADLRRVTLLIPSGQAPDLIADLRRCGRIAVVFNRPSTHRSLQLKGDDATVRAGGTDELPVVEAYVRDFTADVATLGHTEAQVRALVAYVEGDLLAIEFTPTSAFEQTPGPKAGMRLSASV